MSEKPEWLKAGYEGATPSLEEFRAEMEKDNNTWWALDSGHHLNLYEAALEALDAAQVVPQPNRGKLRADLEALSVMLGDLYPNSGYSAVASKAAAALSPAPLTIDREAARSAIEATEVWRVCGFAIDPIIDAVSSVLSAQSAEVPERVASSDESFELGKIAGYDEAMREVAAQPVAGEVEVTDDMVEAGARGLYESSKHRIGWVGWAAWDELGPDHLVRLNYLSQSRAVLTAARAASIEQEGAE